MKQIEIRISSDGVIQAETLGIQGHNCQKYLKEIEELTGAVAVESNYKPEYYIDNIQKHGESVIEETVNSSIKI